LALVIEPALKNGSSIPELPLFVHQGLCGRSWNEAVATTDRGYLQVESRMFWMTAFIQDLQVGLMTAPNAYQDIRLVMFAEMRAQTALPSVN